MQVGGVLLAYQTIQAVDVIPGIHDHSPVQGHRHLRTGPRQCLHFATGINSISQHLINWQLMDNLDASPPSPRECQRASVCKKGRMQVTEAETKPRPLCSAYTCCSWPNEDPEACMAALYSSNDKFYNYRSLGLKDLNYVNWKGNCPLPSEQLGK